jgi:hypothetical protein
MEKYLATPPYIHLQSYWTASPIYYITVGPSFDVKRTGYATCAAIKTVLVGMQVE